MTYTVIIIPSAKIQLDEAYNWLAAQTPQHSVAWYNGMLDALYSLEKLPARCPLANESKNSRVPIYQLLYGHKYHAYRILFSIRDNNVMILDIVHAARQNF